MRFATAATVIVALATLAGCGPLKKKQVHQMGERVQVGPIVYTVIETDWNTELGAGSAARTPQHRFLTVRISMSNVGNKEVTVPLLNLERQGGQTVLELSEGQGVEEWLGVLRTLNPTETHTGRIVFDTQPGAYRLRLTDGADAEAERVAYVDLPLRVQSNNLPEMPAPSSDVK